MHRLAILEAAAGLFAAGGFEATTMADIAASAGVPLASVYAEFPTKAAFALALYRSVVGDVEAAVVDLPEGPMAARFTYLLGVKLALLDRDRPAFTALIAGALDPNGPLGVLSDATAPIRSRMSGALLAVVTGASDCPPSPEPIARLLYGVHLLLIVLWTQGTPLALAALETVAEALAAGAPLLGLPPVTDRLAGLDATFGAHLVTSRTEGAKARAHTLLRRLFHRRRCLPGVPTVPDAAAYAPHVPVLEEAIRAGRPLHLVLPAFPAKSPSPAKVLGTLPDMAEALALRSLQTLCDDLAEAHPPGVTLTICSDGLVFADLVEVPDADVLAYGAAMDASLAVHPSLRRFDLADAWGPNLPHVARDRLLTHWAEHEDEVHERARTSPALGQLLDGMHRFLFEDYVVLHPEVSRTQARTLTRFRAVQLLQRSRAWGRLVSAQFPEAIRLSIHPQPNASEKIGVHLLDVDDAWLTPWHGVVLLASDRFRLVKRAEAEALGARLVPGSHFESA